MQRLRQTTLGSECCRRALDGLAITVSDYTADQRLPQHEHATAYLCLVTRGSYLQLAGGKASDCEQGLLLVHPAGHQHANRFSKRGARCLNIHLDDTLATDPAIRHLMADHCLVRLPDAGRLQHRIESELAETDPAADLALQAVVLELIAHACRQAEPRLRRIPEWLIRVIERLHENPATIPSLLELAKFAGVHPAHLARCFRQVHGVSVGEYQRHLRIERARELLVRTHLPIAAIAAETGFVDQSHFTRVFHRVTGETPRGWRQRMQGWY
jgi:AraC family transcriptional regulator